MSHIRDSYPSSYEEYIEQKVWKDAMTKEYHSILKNDVWDIVLRPERKSVVTSKWIYKINHVVDGSVDKYKSMFVSYGFSQKEGIYYKDTFTLLSKYTTIQVVISLAYVLVWKLH